MNIIKPFYDKLKKAIKPQLIDLGQYRKEYHALFLKGETNSELCN